MTRSIWLCVLALALGALVVGLGPAAAEPLFAGTSPSGIVYQYMGGTTWDAISPSLGDAVLTLTEYEGKLYAGTTTWDEYFHVDVGQVWRYDGDGLWTLVGDNLGMEVCQLVVYNGDLYAGTFDLGNCIARYDGGSTWTMVLAGWVNWWGTRALYVAEDGYMHAGALYYESFGRFDGTTFTEDYSVWQCNGICDFAEYGGALLALTRCGNLWKSTDGISWSEALGSYGGITGELEVFQGLLFMSYDNGELHSTDSTIARDYVWTAPDGIISMAAQGDTALYLGTGGYAGYGYEEPGDGVVYSYDGLSTPVAISGTLGLGIQCLYVQPVLPVDIDIKPGADPNSINLDSAGVIPVAILGSETFDASTVDPSTVCLAGASVRLIGKGDKYSASIQDVNGDGYDDFVCRVETDSVLVEPGSSTAVLEAETWDGQRIRGEDSIRIVPPE